MSDEITKATGWLDISELIRLTGKFRKSAMAKELAARGIYFELGGDGWPLVLHATMLKRAGFKVEVAPPKKEHPKLVLKNCG